MRETCVKKNCIDPNNQKYSISIFESNFIFLRIFSNFFPFFPIQPLPENDMNIAKFETVIRSLKDSFK